MDEWVANVCHLRVRERVCECVCSRSSTSARHVGASPPAESVCVRTWGIWKHAHVASLLTHPSLPLPSSPSPSLSLPLPPTPSLFLPLPPSSYDGAEYSGDEEPADFDEPQVSSLWLYPQLQPRFWHANIHWATLTLNLMLLAEQSVWGLTCAICQIP